MRILFVPAESHPCHESFLEEVFTRGERARACTFLMRAQEGEDDAHAMWNDAPVRILSARVRSRWIRWARPYFTDFRYLPRIAKLVREIRPDVVIARDMTFPLFVALLLRPVFGYVVVFQKTYPNELRWFDAEWVAAHRLPWLWIVCRRFEDWALHQLMRFADANIPITPYMARDLERRWGLDPQRNHPFGMGIDGSEPAATLSPPSPGEPARLVYVGTLAPSRRLERMIDAFALAARRLDPPPRLTVLGGSPEQVEGLRARARAGGVDELVDLRGLVPRAQVYPIVREHHASVAYIPVDPRYVVASPAKVIESLSLGLPVVATRAVAVNDDLARATGAVVLGDDSVDGFAEAITTLVGDLPRLRAAAMRHRQEIIDEYDYRGMAERVWTLLEGLVDDRRRSAVPTVGDTIGGPRP